jgi:acyl-[acyl-carrier-protein]-phospholipid O-acyltransferase/long-chain-fatty-acid--[acyl-carrier-protein] ligase
LGISAGLFAIPVEVFVQARPPEELKGRMIALMNQVNFVAIMLSGAVYTLFDRIVGACGLPRSTTFAMMAVLILPVAIFYRLPTGESPKAAWSA